MNIKTLIAMMFIVLVSAFVTADTTDEYVIQQVDVDGITAESGSAIYVERGEAISVEVWVRGTDNLTGGKDVSVEASISGYEDGDIEDETELFELEPNVRRKVNLRLNIPEDMSASDDYTLSIRVDDKDNFVEKRFTLRIQEKRHYLNIRDSFFNPGLNVKAGDLLIGTIRVENLGDKEEDDIKVMLRVPALGISTRAFIDELNTEEQEDEDDDNENSGELDLFLRIPKNAESGNYDLEVVVDYNRGRDTVTQKHTLVVSGTSGTSTGDIETVVTVDTSSQEISQEQGAVYKLTLANLGDDAETLTIEVSNVNFGTARIDPSNTITVQPDSTAQALIFVAPSETAKEGSYLFNVAVKSGSETVKEMTLEATVVSSSVGDGLRTALIVIFIVLVVVLIILAIIVGARRASQTESSTSEGQLY